MAVYCSDFDLLYIQTPCTASTALGDFLIDNYNGVQTESQHERLSQLKKANYNFCTIRNPFDKIVSQYFKHNFHEENPYPDNRLYVWCHENNPTFESYIHHAFFVFEDDWHWWRYFKSEYGYGDWPWLNDVDFVIHFEYLQSEIDSMFNSFGIKNEFKIVQKNVTANKLDYKRVHTDWTISVIYDKYREYLKATGYSYSGLVRSLL